MTIRLTNLDLGIFAAYLLGIVVLGTWAARRGKGTKRDHFPSRGQPSWWVIGGEIRTGAGRGREESSGVAAAV